MNATVKKRQEQLAALDTEVIRRILDNLAGPEDKEPSPGYPLAGLVHLTGIGQVSVKALRAELARREN